MLRTRQASVYSLLTEKHWNFLVLLVLAAAPFRAADPWLGAWKLISSMRVASQTQAQA
jgi:hypothetical protein